jgi:DNA-binding transcriptional LysR family regulator
MKPVQHSNIDLRQVEVFYHVAKLRSFSKAAETLMLTQPTVSGHIKALEESLALVLFDRLGRQIRLTRAGEVLYGYARRLLSTKSAAQQALQELRGGLHGELGIALTSGLEWRTRLQWGNLRGPTRSDGHLFAHTGLHLRIR